MAARRSRWMFATSPLALVFVAPVFLLIVDLSAVSMLHGQAASGEAPQIDERTAYTMLKLLPEPPIPSDPLELARDGAQSAEGAEQRAAVLELLSRARSVSNVRPHAYDLKTTFTSFGTMPSDGVWTLEDTSPGAGVYRWSAEGPGYSAVYLSVGRLQYGNRPTGGAPLRLAQVRDAIFSEFPSIGNYASLRTTDASLGGVMLRCVLVLKGVGGAAVRGGRRWGEAEYCVDAQSGALVTYSPVPGLYVHYDYASAFHFHDKLIPNAFTIFEAGRTVIEAKTVSVEDAPNASSAIFRPDGLQQLGLGIAMGSGEIMTDFGIADVNQKLAHPKMEVAVGHGVTDGTGKLTELELLASSDPDVNDRLMNHMKRWRTKAAAVGAQRGTTTPAHEVIVVFSFFKDAS